ncbi:glycosyltransferase family 4 protein [Botrimarina mediterranea]|uniref:Putative glycosyl transferase n=1 Tax=Botrimarina mediterranea TaxID=2528022 RepID=A0A518KBK9_9BACT|nr:glycosyltransferase family 4 protein [Botrimarina mediterranea]QDV75181.1 putative glycosyl transferase [Botrimarina mediterranea]
MRILILTQFYDPEPAFKFPDLARQLAARGHRVQVITGFPCYPFGKTYAGYRQSLCQEHVLDGVLVTRVPQVPDHSRSAIRRAIYYFSFALSAATIGVFKARQADVLLVYQSAMPTGLAGWLVSRLRRIPYVLDVVDLWPESVQASGMLNSRAASGAINFAMSLIYNGANRINVITDGYWRNLAARGISPLKLSLIHCWPAEGLFDPVAPQPAIRREYCMEGKFNIVYAGAIGPVQGLRVLLDVAERLLSDKTIKITVAGEGIQRVELEKEAIDRGLTNLQFVGRRPPEEIRRLYACADALLAHLKPDPLSSISIPSKTFAYMASGKPLLMAVEGEAAAIVQRHGCGIAVAPSNAAALCRAVCKLRDMPILDREEMGAAGRRAYLDNYCSSVQVAKFENLLGKVSGEVLAEVRPSHLNREQHATAL